MRRDSTMPSAMALSSRALWFTDPGKCEIRTEPMQRIPGKILVRSLFSGISRGTEALVYHGRVPPSEYERMRAPNQAGRFPFPVKYGYAAVGIVEDGPRALIGQTVFALHPHQDLFESELDDLHVLPEGLPHQRAVLGANMETAVNIVWDAQVSPGDKVVVFGAGVVGLLTAYLSSRIIGTEVTICDVAAEKAKAAGDLGIRFSTLEELGTDYDVLINASASPEALRTALKLSGFESRIVEASWFGDRDVELPLGSSFHAKRLSIVSSQVGSLPAHKRARWDPRRRMALALQLLVDDVLDSLVTGETSFDALAESYASIVSNHSTLCHRIRY